MSKKADDISGKKFGMLTAISYTDTRKGKHYWKCVCLCGNFVNVQKWSLTNGNTKSCGCNATIGRRVDSDISNVERSIFLNYRKGAVRRGIAFELTAQEVLTISQQACFYCGKEKSNTAKTHRRTLLYNGIDRLDNSEGYVVGNVVPCCGICNRMKGTMKSEIFIEQIKVIYERNYK